ncbi:MAG: type II secretion system F family protein [Pseudolabrys sp.]|nr:type II secretion system F family protein [Pseudolabrys sp.]
MPMQTMAMFFLAAVACGGIAWVFVYPILSGERKAARRMESVTRADPVARASRVTQKSRRDVIETTLRELEERQKKSRRPPLSVRIAQAGLDWSKRKFFVIAAGIGLACFAFGILVGAGLLAAVALAFAGACGAPLWLLSFLKKRREAAFIEALPDAVDIIVRGIKAGLPLHDSLRVITAESPEPLRSEFRQIIETQAIGVPLADACAKLYERMPLPEANFFGIVIAIQQRAGGNLAEALGNLSRVLRDRKKMKAKIRAMSQEAKTSAWIIGALPIVVILMVYFTNPNYITLLWTTPLGRVMLAGSAVWMLIGILVMKKMISFDF